MISMYKLRIYFFICIVFCILSLPSQAIARIWDAHAIIDHDVANMCALTFDDGPTHLTAQLLDSLKEENTKATFVVLGSQAKRYPKLIKRMLNEGHEVASHGYAHANLRLVSYEEAYADIKTTYDLLHSLGAKVNYFRPPYGKYNGDVRDIVEQLGMSVLLWSVDSRDWERSPDYGDMPNILERPMSAEEMRGVFLFHDTKVRTVNDARLIITVLRAVGCKKFVTVSEYLNASPTDNKPKQVIAKAPDLNPILVKNTKDMPSYELGPVSIKPLYLQNANKQPEGMNSLSDIETKNTFSYFQSSFR